MDVRHLKKEFVCLEYVSHIFYAVPAHIAQSVEHFLGKEEVTGSSPVMGSKLNEGRYIKIFYTTYLIV